MVADRLGTSGFSPWVSLENSRGGIIVAMNTIRLRKLLATVLGLVYPLTKAKLHRLSHAAGVVLTAGAMIVVWLMTKLTLSEQIAADLALVAVFFTRWRVALHTVDAVVDELPIPDGDSSPNAAPTPAGGVSKVEKS